MAEKIIDIKKGTLTLTDSGLEIKDDATFNRNLLIVSSIFWCVYAGLNIAQYPLKENYFYFYFGVFILALWVVVIGFVIRKVSFRNQFNFSEIGKIRIRKDSKGYFLVRILTTSGRIRGLVLNDNKTDLDQLLRQFKKQKIEIERADKN